MESTKKSLCIIFLFTGISLSAQDTAIKTNLLYDTSTTISLGVESRLASKWTLDLSVSYNPSTFSDSKKQKHWMAQPEVRYWLCKSFNGHLFGLHLLGGQFDVGNVDLPLDIYLFTKGYRYEECYYGVGLTYGCQWLLGKRWSIKAGIDVGYVQSHYDKYDYPKCDEWREKNGKGYFSATKTAISLIYTIE